MKITRTSFPEPSCFPAILLGLAAALSVSCATRGPQVRQPPATYLELRSAPAVATVHFPRGVYTLNSSDAEGFYYRAPRQLIKHAFPGSQPYDGGVFVSRRDPRKLRGYIIWAGGRTKIGDLSREPHAFEN
jgi:hypothetical protein